MKKLAGFGSLLLVWALVSLACNFPFVGTADVQPTPGLSLAEITLTALFAPGGSLGPTYTPIASSTPGQWMPTSTALPATAAATHAAATRTPKPPTAVPPTATKTQKPPAATATHSAQAARYAPGAAAAYLASAPTLDGNWDEWTNTAYPAASVVFGKANWTGEKDLEASFRVGWDEDYLYIAAKVIDDTYVQNATGNDLYKGDSLELLIDTDLYGDFYTQALNSDDYQLGISAGRPDVNGTREAYLWFPSSVAGGRSKVKIGSIAGVDGSGNKLYRVEAAIPWSLLGITPEVGDHFGFALSVSDNDNSSANLQQSMVSSDPYRSLVDPTTWGELVLKY